MALAVNESQAGIVHWACEVPEEAEDLNWTMTDFKIDQFRAPIPPQSKCTRTCFRIPKRRATYILEGFKGRGRDRKTPIHCHEGVSYFISLEAR